MQIAVLIMMHKNPEQVLRLLKWYQTPETVCFIHVDKKLQIDMSEFEKKAKNVKKEVVVSKKRFSGVLATWRLVEITLHLAECARQFEEKYTMHFDYYQLISGQDYPIGKYSSFIKLLNDSYPAPFLNLCKCSDEGMLEQLKRIRYFRIRCILEDHVKSSMVKRVLLIPIYVWEVILTKVVGSPDRILKKYSVIVGTGAAWWILPDEVIKDALKWSGGEGERRMRKITAVLRNTSTPEETFFQTVFLNSQLSDRKIMGNLTHCNFGGRGRVNTGHPYILEMEDLDTLKYWSERNHFFARKFDVNVDEKVLDEIDKQIYS